MKQQYRHMRQVHDAIDMATTGYFSDGATIEFIAQETKLSNREVQWALVQLVSERVIRAWKGDDGMMRYASREELN